MPTGSAADVPPDDAAPESRDRRPEFPSTTLIKVPPTFGAVLGSKLPAGLLEAFIPKTATLASQFADVFEQRRRVGALVESVNKDSLKSLQAAAVGSWVEHFPNLDAPRFRAFDAIRADVADWFPGSASGSVAAAFRRSIVDLGIGDLAIKASERYAEIFRPMEGYLKHLARQFKIIDFTPDQLRWLAELGRPGNWEGELDHEKLTELAAAGWPVAWVPRWTVLCQLIDAGDDDARHQVLLNSKALLLEDCEAALLEVVSDDLRFYVDMAMEVVADVRDGRFMTSQAASAALSDTVCQRVWRLGGRDVQKHAGRDPSEYPWRRYVWALCIVAVAAAFSTFRTEKGDPVPTRYNRHATIHSADPEQYTEANCLCALLTAVSLVRQASAELEPARDPVAA